MTPRQIVADDFTRVIYQIRNPNSMDAWSEHINARTLELLAARVDLQLDRLQAALAKEDINLETLSPRNTA